MNEIHGIFSYEHSLLGAHIAACGYPWEILADLGGLICAIGEKLAREEYERAGESVWISRSAQIAPSACINGPCIIGAGAQVRHCAYIRGAVLAGEGVVIGNSTEVKNSILFDKVQIPHYNYIGDSILGFGAHFGAGAVTSNVKGNGTNVGVWLDGRIETGKRKLGAMVGDRAEIGCGAVLCPGAVIGNDTQIYPLCSVRGTVGSGKIYKSAENIAEKRKTDQGL